MSWINQIVRSLSGHDAGQLYLVLNIEGNKAYLADGRLKKVDRPKMKNIKHLELLDGSDAAYSLHNICKNKQMINTSDIKDEDIRRVIKLYKKSHLL